MKKVSIIKNGQVAYACEGTQEEIDRWFNKHSKKFGNKAHSYQQLVTEEVPSYIEVLEDGTTVEHPAIPAVYEIIHVPADYEIVEKDLEQDRINNEAQEFLNSTDWYCARFVDSGTEIPEDIKQARAEARARIIR